MIDAAQFSALVQRYQMGLAYKAITEQLGPSPQLVAFINYDQVTEDSVGLESFNINAQHEQILADIDADTSFAQSLAILSGSFVTDRAIDNAFGTEGLMTKIFGKGAIFPYTYYKFVKAHEEINLAIEKKFIAAMPTVHTLENWKKFRDDVAEPGWEEFNEKSRELADASNRRGETTHLQKFDESGWSKDRYETEVAFLEKEKKEIAALKQVHDKKIEDAENWVKKESGKTPEGKETARIIKALGIIGRRQENMIEYFTPMMEAVLNKVKGKLD